MKKFLLAFASVAASLNIMAQIGVGIDETSPASKFAIKGNLAVGNGYTTTAAPADGAIIKGKVGIGTNNPTKMLSVLETGVTDPTTVHDGLLINADYGTNAATTSNAGGRWGIHFTGALPGIYTTQKSVGLYAVSEDPLGYNRQMGMSFWVSDLDVAYVERMRIDHLGNVGIGIAAPTQKLDVAGNINTSGNITASGTITAGTSAVMGTGVTGGYYQDATNGAYRAIVSAATTTGYYLQSNAGATTTMYAGLGGTYNGKVGIGTLTPSQRLDVQGGNINTSGNITADGTIRAGTSAVMGTGVSAGYYQDVTNGAYRSIVSAATTNGYYFQTNNGAATTMYVGLGGAYNGNVGIGTNSPGVPLDIQTSVLQNYGPYGALYNSGPGNTTGATWIGSGQVNLPVSMRASGRVICAEFDAVSDKRIKDIIGISNPGADLQLLGKIEVTDFKYKDKVENGNMEKKGFIAQQVESVFPQAVNKTTNFIPDIYAMSQACKYDAAKQTLTVTVNAAHNLTTGDKVRIITGSEKRDVTVAEVVNDKEFIVTEWNLPAEKVFVYGKQVDDFRSVDYDRIYTLNVSATQELAHKVAALEEENAKLKTALKEKAGVNEMSQLKAQLGELKALMEKNGLRSEK